jgi:hypothetical protein
MATTHVAYGSAGVWQAIVNKAFKHNGGIMRGHPHIFVTDGVPDCAAKVGTLVWDVTNSNAYICTVATGTYVKINA